jgi:hypothetical protein
MFILINYKYFKCNFVSTFKSPKSTGVDSVEAGSVGSDGDAHHSKHICLVYTAV